MLSFGALLATAHWPPEVVEKLRARKEASPASSEAFESSRGSPGGRRRARIWLVFLSRVAHGWQGGFREGKHV